MSMPHGGIHASVEFMPTWFMRHAGLAFPDPLTTPAEELVELGMQREKVLHAHYPDLPLGAVDPQPAPRVDWLDCGQMLSVAYGGSRPIWTPENEAWWHDRDFCPWAGLDSVGDVLQIRVPQWEAVPEIEGLFRKLQQTREAFPGVDVPFGYSCWPWRHPNTGQLFRFSYVITFIDSAPFLMGTTPFFTLLAGSPDVATALMEKCFEINTSLSDYLRQRAGGSSVEGINPMVGDFGTFLSPKLFERYAVAYDQMTLARYGPQLPCNIHSCGPSAHVYHLLADYPHAVFMQTRGIAGKLRRLREVLPNTYLQITLHPPQFEFELAAPEEVRSAVWSFAEEAGFRDLKLVVFVAGYGGERIDANVRAFYAAVDLVNKAVRAGSVPAA
jgi:hypothetical protein